MGGGGSSSSSYIRRFPASVEDDCNKINLNTDLQNIQPSINDYKVDDVLNVTLDVNERITVEGEHGVCGFITAIPASQLIQCMKKGKQFSATILKLSDTSCQVRITPN